MVRLFDKPVMEYGVELIKKHGFDRIAVTLQTMPQAVISYFGGGEAFGVQMSYNIEKEPLGTAGGVLAALLNGGRGIGSVSSAPVLVLSGDAVTDYDLRAALDRHNETSADATLILARRPDVLEYGLVMTDERGKITRFIEKPSWGQVTADTVNTGIYILSPKAVNLIPENTRFDFARDLFPLMMERGMGLYGHIAEGYWCDIGDAPAYMQCCRDILDGLVRLDLPEGVRDLRYIGRDVHIGKEVTIGPYSIVGAGSIISDRVSVEGSVLDGAVLEAGSRCTGAYLGRGAVLRENASVLEGAVVGEGTVVGAGAVILENTRIWPRKDIHPGARISGHISTGLTVRGSLFDGSGVVSGLPHVDVTPEFCLNVGLAAAGSGEISLSWRGGEAARLSALAVEAGICAGGGRTLLTDALTPGCAAYTGKAYGVPLNIFLRQDGRRLTLYFYDESGLPPDRAEERRLENLVLRGGAAPADPETLRPSKQIGGAVRAYTQAAAQPPRWAAQGFAPVSLSVGGNGPDADLLRRVLAASGCVPDGAALFTDGVILSAVLEDGTVLNPAHLLAILVRIETACGTNVLALPAGAPAFLDDYAARQGAAVLRPERDGDAARSLSATQLYMRDPIFHAARLVHGCRKLRTTLPELYSQLPPFHIAESDAAVEADRGAVMRVLARQFPNAEFSEGLCTRARGGWVRVAPTPNRSTLRIIAEGWSAELAEEICADFHRLVQSVDGAEK
jgi:mannose-1-phosphate guanylyltransferase/phosphomannomutase